MENKKINKKYTPEFKIWCIIQMRQNFWGYKEACRNLFGVPKGKEQNYKKTLKCWERIYLNQGEAGFYLKPQRKPKLMKKKINSNDEFKKLKQENEYLRAEVAYLKKVRALIQAEKLTKDKK